MATNLMGSIDLLKLRKTCVVEIKGVKCVIIPVNENDINVTMTEDLKPKSAFLSMNIMERREPSKYGHTHYIKPYYRMHFLDQFPTEDEKKAVRNVYLGDLKPLEFGAPMAEQTANGGAAPAADKGYEDLGLPF